jgi:hypothetical protein
VILLIALGAWLSATQPVFGPQTRFDIIMAVILSQTVVLAWLVLKLFELLAELRNQHAAAAHVRTARGIWHALQVYADAGGIDPAYRSKLHAAGDEQFRLYDDVLSRDPGRSQTRAETDGPDVRASGGGEAATQTR